MQREKNWIIKLKFENPDDTLFLSKLYLLKIGSLSDTGDYHSVIVTQSLVDGAKKFFNGASVVHVYYNYFRHLKGLTSNASSVISLFNDPQPPNKYCYMINKSPCSLQMVSESTPNENPSDKNKSAKKTLSID